MSDASTPRRPPGPGDVVSGRVSNVSGGQVAVGNKVVQIDAHGGAHVVVNEGVAVQVTRRDPPILRPAPAFPGFIGRASDIAAVSASLQGGRSVEVVGPSGIGKTALLRVISNAGGPDPTPDGVVAVPPRLGVAETLNYLFDACYEGTRRMVPRREELTSALTDLRLLVVLDDPLLDRESLDQLRLALPASLFLTSAHEQRIYRDVDGVALAGMSPEEGVALIEAYVGRSLTDRERSVGVRVNEVLGGTPLELVRFASLVRAATDGDLVSVARGFGVDAQPADVLVAVQRSTSAAEDAVLRALAAFAAPVGASLVAAMSGQRDAGELLTRLADRGLVGGDDLQGWRLREHQVVQPEDRRRAAEVLSGWIRHRTVPEEVAAEIPAITAVLEAAQHDQRWDDAVTVAAAAERPLALSSRWAAWEATLRSGLAAAKSAGDAPSERFFAHQLEVVRSAMAPPSAQPAPPEEPPRPADRGEHEHAEFQQSSHGLVSQPPVRHRWGSWAAGAVVAIGLVVVVVLVARSMSDRDTDPPPPPGVVSAELAFGEVTVGEQRAQGQPLALPGAVPPVAMSGADGPFVFVLEPVCSSDPDACSVEVTFRPVEDGEAASQVEVTDAAGQVVAVVSATGTGVRTPPTGRPNLVAFTLGDESDVLVRGEEERRTVRVFNQPDDGVTASTGSVLSVVVEGPVVLRNPPESCRAVSDRELRCDVGPLAVDARRDFVVTLLAEDVGVIQLVSTMLTEDGDEGRRQVREFTVDPGTDTRVTCTVPALRGVPIDEARKQAEAVDLVLDARVVEDGQASGLVLTQNPSAGTEVECGSTIAVSFSGVG